MVRLYMCASLHKKSTVCKQDVLSVRILSTRRFNKKPELHIMLRQPPQMHAANAADATSLECLS